MSILTYNGITLPYANCTMFDQSPIYDEVGRVDPYLTRFEIAVTCVINASYASMLDGGTNTLIVAGVNHTSNPAQLMAAVRARLLQPRMALSYKFNGIELIPQPPEGISGTVDARNGPMTDCQVFSLTNESFMIKFHVVAHYWEKNVTDLVNDQASTRNEKGCPVISNRWVEQVVLDPSGYSTRVRTGKYVIRSDNPEGLVADRYRDGFAACSVPPGFVRVNSRYDLSPDGLGIQYEVIDREVFKLPPAPAFEAQGRYIETSTKNGAFHFGQVRLAMRAPKTVQQSTLINVAIGVASTKLISRGALAGDGKDPFKRVTIGGKDGFGLLTQCVLVVDMYDNNVELVLEVMLAAQSLDGKTDQRIGGIAGLAGGKYATYTPGSENETGTPARRNLPHLVRGTASLLLQSAAYYDPSLSKDRNQLGVTQMTINENPLIGDNKVQTAGGRYPAPGQAGTTPELRRDG